MQIDADGTQSRPRTSNNILVKLAMALHLPGFTHDHSHADLVGRVIAAASASGSTAMTKEDGISTGSVMTMMTMMTPPMPTKIRATKPRIQTPAPTTALDPSFPPPTRRAAAQ